MYDALNNSEIAPNICDQLVKMVHAMEAGDFATAHMLMMEMFTKAGGANWTVGVKRLVETVAASQQR